MDQDKLLASVIQKTDFAMKERRAYNEASCQVRRGKLNDLQGTYSENETLEDLWTAVKCLIAENNELHREIQIIKAKLVDKSNVNHSHGA